ncbi:MAG: hypothetical protein KGN00_08570 [Chloroflexota bacterium]|nr:hypothetical protein [Chloroflexota bacterium]MDE3193722.1 hypothetical protein [Chloroflexota bacterium]
MSRESEAFLRFVVICAAWAAGQVLEYAFGVVLPLPVVPAIFAVAAYMATRDIRVGGGGGGGDTYWRGQRIDRDRWRH